MKLLKYRDKTLQLALGFVVALSGTVGRAATSSPTAASPAKQGARETAALLDMNAMRDAEVMAFLDTNYLHTLENLNDLVGFDTNFDFDDIDENGLGTQVIDVHTGRFRPQRVDLTRPPWVWQGPYVTFQQGHFSIDGEGYDPGTPTDPWGNPYYLFTPLGLVNPPLGSITLELYGDDFDRYAIVSLAGDGVMSGDDLVVFFGGAVSGFPATPTTTQISSVRPAHPVRGQTARVRGYNFGATEGDSRVELNGRVVETIDSWNDREIVFEVPAWAESGELLVVRSFTQSNAFSIQVQLGARHWSLYR